MRRGPAACLALLGCLAVAPARAQTLYSVSTPALAIATPSESDYDAGVSDPSPNYTVITSCTGRTSAGCRLFLQYGGNGQAQQVDMQYAIVSLGSGDCQGAAANPNAWFAVHPNAVVLTTRKNRVCVATFRFRVNPLAWSTITSPGPPGGGYRQQVGFVLTRP